MLCDTINKPAILHASSSSIEERLSKLEQEHHALKQEIEALKEEDQKKDQQIEALKQKIQRVEQVCTSNAELLSNAVFRIYQLEVSQACFYRKYKVVDRNSSIYDAFSPEDLDHHEQKIKMKEVYDSPPIKSDIKGSKFQQVIQRIKEWFLENRQKKSYRNQELLRSFGMDPKTLKKVILNIQRKYPNCFEYVQLDSKNKGLFLSNRELFERMVFTW